MNTVDTVRTVREGPGVDHAGECSLCAQTSPFNAVTLAALQETEAIAAGKIQVEWQRSSATKKELKAQIRKMIEEA
jgi:hypothetical protein